MFKSFDFIICHPFPSEFLCEKKQIKRQNKILNKIDTQKKLHESKLKLVYNYEIRRNKPHLILV